MPKVVDGLPSFTGTVSTDGLPVILEIAGSKYDRPGSGVKYGDTPTALDNQSTPYSRFDDPRFEDPERVIRRRLSADSQKIRSSLRAVVLATYDATPDEAEAILADAEADPYDSLPEEPVNIFERGFRDESPENI